MKKKFLLMISLSCLISCCTQNRIELALELAEENRPELERVLEHFSDDSARLAAAKFLIGNMPGKITLDTTSVSSSQPFFDAFSDYRMKHGGLGITGLYDMLDSVKSSIGEPTISPSYLLDVKTLSSEFLIGHIDKAVDEWSRTKSKNEVSFDEFCRFVLPYRIYESWWKGANSYFRDKYAGMVTGCANRFEASEIIKSDVSAWFRQDGTFFRENSFLSPTTFYNTVKTGAGVCYDYNAVLASALRSVGIPAAIDMVPYWGNSNARHFWTEIVGAPVKGIYDNTQMDFRSPDDELINDTFWFKDGIIDDTIGIPSNVKLRKCRTVPKIYRLGYDIQGKSLAMVAGEDIPSIFRNPAIEDITANLVECKAVSVKIVENTTHRRFAYLCCYDPDSHWWTPVAWGRIKGGKVKFADVGVNILYMAAYYKDGDMIPFSSPFILQSNGELRYLDANPDKSIEATLFSKVPLRTSVAFYAMVMRGDRIMFANRCDLSDTTTIFKISEIPYYTQEITIHDSPPARYMVYKTDSFPIKFVAELEFIGETEDGRDTVWAGTPFGNPCYSMSPTSFAFDGDRLTYAYIDKVDFPEDFIALDLGQPRKIKKLRYCPRNDDNAIIPGNQYELFYWDDGWKSLGRKAGEDNRRLHYDNVPDGALLWLHNHTHGKENRPFTIENGIQVWW